jgi:hypothetical protein
MTMVGRASGRMANDVGRGLIAGLVGTAAMTVSSSIEARMRDRGSSTTPATAAGAVLGVKPVDDQGEKRFNNFVHWTYGTSLGLVRAALGMLGLHGAVASAVHLAIVWGGEQAVLPATGAGTSAASWDATEIGVDVVHHVVYATVTSWVFDAMGGEP